jgi:GWxTD domain-containing protein
MFMPSSKIRGAAVLVALALLPAGAALAGSAGGQGGKTEKREQRKKRELDDVFKRWLKEDVLYIISPEERDAFNKLGTDEEREQFIEQFWVRRDPDPNTPENEYREEHYRRVAYANQHYTSGIPGWKTDRGRVYIAWGKPDEVESYPTGSQYNRPMYEGGGSTTTYAFEIWWYRYLEGIGSDVELEFVDTSGTGEYRIALDSGEKDALKYVSNSGLTQWEQLGLSTKAERLSGSNRYGMTPANKTLFAKLETWVNVQRGPGPNTAFKDLLARSDLPEVEANALPFALRTDFYRVSESSVVSSLTVQIDNSELSFANQGGISEAKVNIYGILTQLSGKGAGRFEDIITTPRFSDQNLALGQKQKSVYQKNILLPPGNYKLEILARDTASGKTGVVRQSFVVPRYQEAKLGTSSVVLAARMEPVTNRVAAGQFVIGRFKVIPNVTNAYKASQPMAIFFQVYDTQVDQTTLKPDVAVDYVISQNGKEVSRISDHFPIEKADSAASGTLFDMAGSQLAIGRMVPVEGLAPGNYTIQVRVTDRVAQKTVNPEADFTIVE